MKTPTELSSEIEAAVTEANDANFPAEAEKLPIVREFYEIRGLHRRGKVGSCALRTAYENAKRAVTS